MGCVVYSLTAISVSADDEHIQCEHTNFLFYRPPSSDWLRLSSQWQMLCVFEVVVNVCVCFFFCCVGVLVCLSVRACMCRVLRGLSGPFFGDN